MRCSTKENALTGGGAEPVGRRQQHLFRTEPAQFPPDFADRLTAFRAAADISWRELARQLQVNVRTVHRWRQGARPDAGHLLSLLELASERDLLQILAPSLASFACCSTTQMHGSDSVTSTTQAESRRPPSASSTRASLTRPLLPDVPWKP